MINFNNKYLTYAALILIVYLMYSQHTFSGVFKTDTMAGSSARYSLTIDPYKKEEDRSLVEKMILKFYDKELKPFIKNPKSLLVAQGLYITMSISDKVEMDKEQYQPQTISGVVGFLKIDPEIEKGIIGMSEKQTKEITGIDNKVYKVEIIGVSELTMPKKPT